ncbi:hypothetical protein ACFFNY_05985 [Paenibacillus hodogayensis]|uniref:Uncharacterized protein n=1 Tax=Paenibacillus hodogayensis TaxID=279208 RepID=A0ABV5VSA6_9BACL
MRDRVCKICGKGHYAKDLCQKCYIKNRKQQLLEAGNAPIQPAKAAVAATTDRGTCAAWLCNEEVYGMGVCAKHYEEWAMENIALGDMSKKQRKPRTPKPKQTADSV